MKTFNEWMSGDQEPITETQEAAQVEEAVRTIEGYLDGLLQQANLGAGDLDSRHLTNLNHTWSNFKVQLHKVGLSVY
jgi:hypothetical protein